MAENTILIQVLADDQASAIFQKIAASITDFGRVTAVLQPVSGSIDTIARSLDGLTPPTDRARDALGRFVATGVDPAATSAARVGTAAGAIAAGLAPIAPEADKARDGLGRFTKEAQDGGPKLTMFQQIAVGALRQIGAAAIDLAGQAGQAIVGFVTGSVQAAGDFEAGMNNFAAAAGESLAAAGLSVEDFRNQFIQIGADLPVSTAAVQEAAITLVKGGLDPMVVKMGALTDSIQFAAAAEMDLNAAAELSIKQLGTFVPIGASAAEQTQFLAQANDLLVKAAGASTLNVDKLGAALLAAGGQAKASGVDYQDFVTTMGMISPAFDSAATAGTSYKNFLTRLVPTTKAAKDGMSDLGLMFTNTNKIAEFLSAHGIKPLGDDLDTLGNQFTAWATAQGWSVKEISKAWDGFSQSKFFDLDGKFVGNAQAAELLKTALAGLSDEQRSAALTAIFGNDAMGAAIALASAGADGYAAFAGAMDRASGVTDTAKLKQQGFNTALDNVKGSLEAVQLVIGGAVIPIITQLLNDTVAPAINAFRAFASAVLSAANPWQAFLDGLNSAIPGLGTVVGFVADNLLPILAGLAAVVLYTVVPAFWAWAFAAETGAVATALAMLPITLTLAAIGAAVAFLVAAWQHNWFGIQEATAAAWAALQPTFTQLASWLQIGLTAAVQAAAIVWTTVLWPALQLIGAFVVTTVIPALSQLGTWLATNIPLAIAATVATFTTIVGVITAVASAITLGLGTAMAWLSSAWATVSLTASTAWASITTTVSSALATVGLVIQTGIGIVSTIVLAAWNTVVFLTAAAWASLIALISPAVQTLAAIVGPPIQIAVATVSAAWTSLVAGAQTAWAAVSAVVGGAAGAVVGVLSTAWASITTGATSAWAAITSAVTSAIATVQAGITSGVAAITSGVASGWATVQSSTSGVWASIQSAVTNAIAAVKTVIETGVNLAKTVVLAAWAVIVAASQNNFSAIPTIISTAWGRIKSLFADGVTGVRDALLGLAADAGNIASAIVSGLVRGIANGIGSVINAAKNLAESAYKAAMGALDAHSPSRIFAQVGSTVPAGMAVGITTGMPAVNKSLVSGIAGLSESAAKAIESGSQAIAAANAYGGGAGLGAFLADFTQLAVQFNAAAVALGGQILGTATRFADTIGKMSEPISKAVAALQGLNDLVTPSVGAISAFTATLAVLLSMLTATATSMDVRGLAAAVQFADAAGKILAVVKTGVDAFAALNTYVQPVPGQVTAFTGKLAWLIQQFVQAGGWLQGAGLAAGVVLAAAADKILAVVKTGVDAFAALNTYVQPVPGQVTAFTGKLAWLIQQFVQAGAWLRGPGLAAGVVLAESAGKIVAIIKPAVEGFAALPALVAPSMDATKAFAAALGTLVSQLWLTAKSVNVTAVQAAATFAEAAGKVIAILKNGVDGLNALAELAPVAYAQVALFGNGIDSVVWMLFMVADDIGQKATDAAATFAEAAGKVIAILKNGVDGLNALAELAPVAYAQVALFGNGIDSVVWMLFMVADDVSQSATDAAAKFAEAAGKVIAILKNGVDGLNALQDLHQVSDQAIQSFVALVNRLMVDLGAAASQFSLDAIAAAGKFAEAAGKAVGILKTGVEGLLNVDTFTGVSEAAITRFADGVRLAVAAMARLAAEFGAEATASAKAFAQAAGESTDFLKKGVDGFGKLAEMKDIPLAGLKLFEAAILQLMQTMIALSAAISVQMLTDATRIANAIDSVITVLSNALKALVTLGDSTVAMPSIITAFTTAVKTIGAELGKATVAPAGNIGAAVIAAIGAGMLAAIPGAIAYLNTLQAQLLIALTAISVALVSPVLTIGQQIALGLAQGIGAGTPAIVTAVYAAINAALAAARSALGIASPSKVFDQIIGQQAGAGLAQGLDRSIPVVAAASARLATATIAPAQTGIAPRAAPPVSTSSSSRSVTLQVAPGAIVVHANPGESGPATADRGLDRLEAMLRMAQAS